LFLVFAGERGGVSHQSPERQRVEKKLWPEQSRKPSLTLGALPSLTLPSLTLGALIADAPRSPESAHAPPAPIGEIIRLLSRPGAV
jgi:hypothetical protein